ncbi:MAG: arginine--tRNA ligase [Bacilli bacterium]|nr:arginine--tRNA ligase [Bacilli bacterium]
MNKIEESLKSIVKDSVKKVYDIELLDTDIVVEIPKDPSFGDYSTNVAMRLTKQLRQNPRAVAEKIVEELKKNSYFEDVTIAGPGFINFRLSKKAFTRVINDVLLQNNNYGKNSSGKGLRILVEYVSANPTGDLHLGHARGAVWGDCITRLLNASGYDCLREYYVNDGGHQIDMLSESLYSRYCELFGIEYPLPEDGYHAQDIIDIAKQIKEEDDDKWLHVDPKERFLIFKDKGIKLELAKIERDLSNYNCEFDSWISEKSLYDTGYVQSTLELMEKMGLTYEQDGALWLKTTLYGDDKDRVLRKQDGSYTYFTPDIANHIYKLERGYTKLVNLWGADHHGYVPRMCGALDALGNPKNTLEVDIIQMVRLVENGKEVKMSKRTGNAITIRELCEEVGVDAARYTFVSRAVDTHLDFDIGIAKSKTSENPVYYAQYAHARICSLLKEYPIFTPVPSYDLIGDEKEKLLIKQMNEFPEIVADAALTRAPHKICNFIQKFSQYIHSYYGSFKIKQLDNQELINQRLCLLKACKITLKNALGLIGVSAPESMNRE